MHHFQYLSWIRGVCITTLTMYRMRSWYLLLNMFEKQSGDSGTNRASLENEDSVEMVSTQPDLSTGQKPPLFSPTVDPANTNNKRGHYVP